jgi:hypothetical protein
MGKWEALKTTVEMPDALFRKAKATAAERGLTLKSFLTGAVEEHLRRSAVSKTSSSVPAWMSAFGGLRHLHKETVRINRILQREFEQVDEDEWR